MRSLKVIIPSESDIQGGRHRRVGWQNSICIYFFFFLFFFIKHLDIYQLSSERAWKTNICIQLMMICSIMIHVQIHM